MKDPGPLAGTPGLVDRGLRLWLVRGLWAMRPSGFLDVSFQTAPHRILYSCPGRHLEGTQGYIYQQALRDVWARSCQPKLSPQGTCLSIVPVTEKSPVTWLGLSPGLQRALWDTRESQTQEQQVPATSGYGGRDRGVPVGPAAGHACALVFHTWLWTNASRTHAAPYLLMHERELAYSGPTCAPAWAL